MHAWCPKLATKSYDFQTKDNLFKYVSVENVLSAQWKAQNGILTDEKRTTDTDLAPPPVGLNFMNTMFFNGKRMTIEEFQREVTMPSVDDFDGEVDMPSVEKDLSIPHFPEETRMKLQWFDDGKVHVEKYFDAIFQGSMYKETYAPIPNFLSDTPKVDITWFDAGKEFVKNNWVLVGDDIYAKPGSVHTKQGRFNNSIEWTDPRDSIKSIAKKLNSMTPDDNSASVAAINERFMTSGVTEPMGGVVSAVLEECIDNVANEPVDGPPKLRRAMSENVL